MEFCPQHNEHNLQVLSSPKANLTTFDRICSGIAQIRQIEFKLLIGKSYIRTCFAYNASPIKSYRSIGSTQVEKFKNAMVKLILGSVRDSDAFLMSE